MAQADLDEIRDYNVEHCGLAQAIRYLDAIEAAFQHILEHPKSGNYGKI